MNQSLDAQLLAQLKQGKAAAYDALFLKYYKMLCVHAYFYLAEEEEAKELVQQFFVAFWEKGMYHHLEGDIKGYLYQAIKHKCLNRLRKWENEQKLAERVRAETIAAEEEDREVVENLYYLLEQALHDLPMQRREALTMVYIQDKRYRDVAQEMGISINSLKTHLKLGLKNLRERLKNKQEA
ncbi:RNA polymerase sigma-70 factor [Olivibacter ginsenosidimutans]|uniref:RNA polymerase sigma-70 factor n=1 Tax=Olivibacter ginsenosidimutans TaxID=1176537 RepID=A0ABP9AE76_9SPHI